MIKYCLNKCSKVLLRLVPENLLRKVILDGLQELCRSSRPQEALRFLLELDNRLYKLEAKQAKKLNNGIHPKHRILKYKEWFKENIQASWTVIDVGCNTGMLPEVLSDKADFVYGIEIIESHIQQANEFRKKKNVEFICADATTYDFSKCRPVDCVTLSNVLEHIDDRTHFMKKILEQINWKDQGKKTLLIRVPVFDRDWVTLFKKEFGVEWRLDRTHFTEYTDSQFHEEMEAAGIKSGIFRTPVWRTLCCL